MNSRLQFEFFTFVLALQLLTRLPIRLSKAYSEERMAASVRYFPLVGLLIGIIAASTYKFGLFLFPVIVAILVSTAVTTLVTGGFHEDGLADTFDGIGGGSTAAHSLEIMKDSRIGVFGLLALTLALATKVASLTALPATTIAITLVSAHCLSRWSTVLVIATSSYARDEGAGKPTSKNIGKSAFAFATLSAVVAIALLYYQLSPLLAGCSVIGLAMSHVLIRLFFERKIGGYTGDCLGATQQVGELGIYLGLLACQ